MNFNQFLDNYQKVPVEHYPNKVSEKPLVSVCVQTYQHVNFIKECLDGILMQETNFDFEILLGEDVSTDGTREICIEYAEKYPDKIRLFLHRRENNISIGGSPTGRFNLVYNLFSAKGKYIALCEGDDYWTDPKKLQKQVDFLEANNEFVCSFHDCIHINEKGEKIKGHHYSKTHKKVLSQVDLMAAGGMSTLTVMFRKSAIEEFPSYFNEILNADLVLWSILGKHGKAYFDESIEKGVYRIHGGGVYSMKDIEYKIKNHIATLEYIKGDIDSIKAKEIINTKIAKRYLFLAKNSLKVFEPIQFIKNIFLSMKYHFNSSVN